MKYKFFTLIILSITLIGCNQNDQINTPKNSDSEIIQNLQKGGNVIYMRHVATEKDYADQISAEMGNCATQRALSEKGWKDARIIGQAFKDFNIPIQQVYSSEYCRAWQTADLAFGEYAKNEKLNFYPAEEYTDEQFAKMKDNVMPLLTKQPDSSKNIIIVGHDDPFESATGIYPEPQGVMYILKPTAENFKIVGSISPSEWPTFY